VIKEFNKIILWQDIKKLSHKVKSKVYFILSNRCFCGEGFKAKRTNGSDFSSTHSAIPFFALLMPDALKLIIVLASDFTMALGFCFLLLSPEYL
jgi:hypothetical protein